jgi:nitrous oxidase accessory protein
MPQYFKAALLLLLCFSTTISLVAVKPAKAEGKTITVPQDFGTINSAIGNASSGDTVFVKAGVYNENLIIDKALTVIAESASTIIDGGGRGTVVWINANNTVVSGFTIRNSGSNFTDSGIYVDSCQGVNLSGNMVTENNIGIYLNESPKSQFKDNSLAGNKFNFGVYSSTLEGYVQDIDESNTVEGKPIVYWVGQVGKQVPAEAGYIAAVNCSDVTISGGVLEKNWQNLLFAYTENSTITNVRSTLGMDSIWLLESTNCTLQNNNVTGNVWGGVALVNTSDCTVQGNTFKGNGGYGLFLSDSSNNQFYHNNFINNPRQAWLYGDNSNSWDNGYPSGGNYWSNYTGADDKSGLNQNVTGSDGIRDTPIVIAQNNIDNYPLIQPWTQEPASPSPGLEFSVMAFIAVTLVFVIFIGYFVKKLFRRKQADDQVET